MSGLEFQIVQSSTVAIRNQNEIATPSAVRAIRPSARNVLFSMKTNRPRPAAARTKCNNRFVQEHRQQFTICGNKGDARRPIWRDSDEQPVATRFEASVMVMGMHNGRKAR